MTSLLFVTVLVHNEELDFLLDRDEPRSDTHFDLANELLNFLAVFFAVVPDSDGHDLGGVFGFDVAVLVDPVALVTAVLSKTRFPGCLAMDSDVDAAVHSVEHTPFFIDVSPQGVNSYDSVVLMHMRILI